MLSVFPLLCTACNKQDGSFLKKEKKKNNYEIAFPTLFLSLLYIYIYIYKLLGLWTSSLAVRKFPWISPVLGLGADHGPEDL
jgi:hypothetical protein